MKNTKKILGLVLALIVLTLAMSMSIFAQDTENVVLPDGITAESFGNNTVTDGTNFYTTIKSALEGIHLTDNRVLYCKPGADVGVMTHGHVCANLIVYGNGAYLTASGEQDFELDTYKFCHNGAKTCNGVTGELTLTVKNLNGCGAWGQRATSNTVNIVFENCKDMNRVYINGTSGINNITLINCSFLGSIENRCTLYSNANGTVKVSGCVFENIFAPINLNHKVAGTQTIVIENTAFNTCGTAEYDYAAPVRVLSSVEGAESALKVSGCTFANTVANKNGQDADILLDYGVGSTNASVSSTSANVTLEKENNVGSTTVVASTDNKSFSNVEVAYAATVNGVGYATLGEAIGALKDGETLVILKGFTAGANEFIELNGKKNITITAADDVVINGNIQIGYHSSHSQADIGVDRSESTLTVDGLTVNGTLIVISNDANCVVSNSTAAQLTVKPAREGMSFTLSGNTADGLIGTATEGYGIFVVPHATAYNLAFDGNTLKNVSGHAITIQGCGEGSAVTYANSITFKNNIFDSWGLGGKSNRAAIKIWKDTKYAPADGGEVTKAMKELVWAVTDEAAGNKFNSTASNTVEFDAYGVAGDGDVIAPSVTYVATINGVGYESFADALAAAKAMTGDVVVEILGKVTLNTGLAGSYDSIKFVGKTETAEIYLDLQGYSEATGEKVAFENLKLSKVAGGYIANAGFMNLAFGVFNPVEVTYTNCIFLNGAYASGGTATFTGCDFYSSHDRYSFWAYGGNIVIDDCDFVGARGIKMYSENHVDPTINLTVKNSDFTAADGKPAIVLTYGTAVTLEDNVYPTKGVFELDLDGKPNGVSVTSKDTITCINDKGACGVLVDGQIYTTVAQAAAVATEGSKVTLLHNSTETVELAEGVTLNKNGYTADGVTVKVAKPMGTLTNVYTSADGYWGECGGNAKESFGFKFYNGNTYMGSTFLNNIGGIIDGDVYVSWSLKLDAASNADEYWTMEWTIAPTIAMQPTRVEQWVDGVKVADAVVEPNWSDKIFPVIAAVTDADGKILSYVNNTQGATLQDAIAAAKDGEKIVLLSDADLDFANHSGYKYVRASEIDLNGKTLTVKSGDIRLVGTTIKNGSVVVDPTCNPYSGAAVFVAYSSSYAFDTVNFTATGISGTAILGLEGTGSSLNITNSVFTIDNENAVALTSLISNYSDGVVVIEDSDITVKNINGRACLHGSYVVKGESTIVASGVKAGFYIGAGKSLTINDTSEVTVDNLLSGYTDGIYLGDATAVYTKAETATVNSTVTSYVTYVAEVNGVGYATLADALAAANNGDTITLIWAEGDAPIAMNGSVYGKSVTITGTATVDWSKGFLFIGRGGEGDGTVIFNNANLTSASNNSATGIHVSGREKDTNDKYNGTLEIKNSTIELDYLINKGTMTLDNSTLTVKNGFSIGGRPAHETEDGKDATATLTLNNGSKVVVNNHNGMGLGYEAIGVMYVNGGSTFECTQDFLVTAKGTMNVNGGTIKVAGNLTNNGTINVGGTVTLNVPTVSGNTIDANNGAVINASTIGGTLYANGNIEFKGANKVNAFNAGWYNHVITIGENASLKVTTGRLTISYGNVFNITGTIADAKNADKSTITPSLELVAGISFNGNGGGVKFNVENAYVVLGDSTTKNSGATGEFNLNFDNSIVDFTQALKTYVPTVNGLNPQVKIAVNGSVVTFASHLELWNPNTVLTLNNSNLTVGGSFANAGTVNVNSGSYFLVEAPIMSSHGGNTGSININGGTFELADNNEDWQNAGTITVAASGKLVTNDFKCVNGGKIIVDANDYAYNESITVVDGNGVYSFDGVVELVNGDHVAISYDNGDVTIQRTLAEKTYEIGAGKQYATLADAIAAAKADCVLTATFKIYGEAKLETGFSHGIVDFGVIESAIIEGADATAKLTIVGGGVPDIKGVTIKNITFADKGAYLPTANEFMYQNFIDTKFENVTFVDGIRLSGNCTLTDCTVIANTTNEYAIWFDDGEFTIENTKVTVGDDGYGMIKSDAADKITLRNNTFTYTGNANKEALNTNGAVIIATGNTFVDCTAGIVPADKTNYTSDGTTSITDGIVKADNTVKINVAEVNGTKYETIAEAIAAAKAGETVKVLAGEYSMPSMKAGITIEGVGEVLFKGTLTGTLENLTLKNIHIKGSNAQRWAYAKGNLVFENVTFEATSVYAIHFDGITAGTNLTYKNCTIIGWAAMSGSPASCVFDGCTIKGNGTYGVIRTYFDAKIENCTFDVANVNTNDAYQDGIHAVDGATVIVNNCTNVNGSMADIVNIQTSKQSQVVVDGKPSVYYVETYEELIAALKNDNANVIMLNDITAKATQSSGYGVAGIVVDAGDVLNGNGFKLTINGAGATWDCAIAMRGGEVKNLTIAGAMRGVFMPGANGDVVIDNCKFENVIYTFNSDAGSKDYTVTIKNTTINGWTSFSAVHKSVTFEKCTFGKGNGYAFCRPYQATTFTNCEFNEGYEFDAKQAAQGTIVFDKCTYNGEAITETVGAEMFYAGGTVVVDGTSISYTPNVAEINGKGYKTLQAAIAAIGSGNVVIDLVADATLDYNARDAYGLADTASVTINGNGKTLTLNQKNSDWASIGLANANGKLVLKNMTIEKTGYGDTSGAWNTHAIIFKCNVEMTDVTVNNSVAVQNGATLDNVTINEANGYYGLWINANGQTVTMTGGEINATNGGRGIKIADQYVDSVASVTLNITGTKFNTAKKAAVLVSSTEGAEITVSGIDISGVAEDKVNAVWVDEDWSANYGKVTVTGATVAQENVSAFAAAITSNGNVVGYYKTIADALAAAKAGDTITLIRDITSSSIITIDKSITLDGNDKKLTYTGAARAIDVPNTVANANVTIKNLTIDFTSGYSERGINYNTNGTLTLDNVTINGKDVTYAVNFPGSSNGANVVINNSNITGLIALNVWGKNMTINVTDTALTSVDKATHENYAAVKLNNNGSVSAEKTVITINGGSITALDENKNPSSAATNSTATGEIIISNTTTVTGNINTCVAIVTYNGYSEFYSCFTLQAAIDKAANDANATVKLLRNITVDEALVINGDVVIDLNGKKVTSTAKKAFEVHADATIKNGTIEAANRCVDTRTAVNLTLADLTLVADKYTSYGNPQPLTIGGSVDGTVVTMSYVNINAGKSGYGIISFVQTNLTATNSTISGYSALYVKAGSEDSVFTFNSCTLTGDNTNNDVEGNSFGAIALQANDITVTVDANSTINANGNNMYAIAVGSTSIDATGNTVTVSGTIKGNIIATDDFDNTVKVKAEYADELVNAGYGASAADTNGLVTVEKRELTNIVWKDITLSLDSDLKINFYLVSSSLVEGYNYYARVIIHHDTGCNENALCQVRYIPMNEWLDNNNGIFKKIAVDGLAAKDMACKVEVQIFVGETPVNAEIEHESATIEVPANSQVVSTIGKLSILDYCKLMFSRTDAEAEEVKPLLADLLVYGASAQKFFGHYILDENNNPVYVTNGMDEIIKKYATGVTKTVENNVKWLTGDQKYYNNFALTLETTIYLNFYFDSLTAAGTGIEDFDINKIQAHASFTHYQGKVHDVVYSLNDGISLVYDKDGNVIEGMVKVIIEDIAPADLFDRVTIELVYGDQVLAGYETSAEDYCAHVLKNINDYQKPEELKEVMNAILAFAEEAERYFSK